MLESTFFDSQFANCNAFQRATEGRATASDAAGLVHSRMEGGNKRRDSVENDGVSAMS